MIRSDRIGKIEPKVEFNWIVEVKFLNIYIFVGKELKVRRVLVTS